MKIKIWNKKKKIKVEKNIEIIFNEKIVSYKELNSNISLDFSQANVQNKIIDDKNNFGRQNYSGKLKKIKNFKFFKFNNENDTDLNPLFLNISFISFSKFLSTASGFIIDKVCSILLIIILY